MSQAESAIPIIFNPPDNQENQYIRLLVDGIEKNGFVVSALDDLFKSGTHFHSIRLVHLNWFENLDESSKRAMWKSFFRKTVALLAIKASGKKLVWTMHNRLSHEKRSGRLSNILVRLLLKSADAVVIHCAATETVIHEIDSDFQKKVLLIPHPHFIGVYGAALDHPVVAQEPLKLLFLGAVKPYKNLELLIRVCNELGDAVHLTIAGKAASEEYAVELRRLASGASSIDLRLGFVEDRRIPDLLAESELLVLPYDLRSSLNSGTVILAWSYARSVICPRIGTIDESAAGDSENFSYTYASQSEHEAKLRQAIAKALTLKKNDSSALLEMGKNMQAHVRKANDPEVATDGLSQLYLDLLS